jgi:hypothetical protein
MKLTGPIAAGTWLLNCLRTLARSDRVRVERRVRRDLNLRAYGQRIEKLTGLPNVRSVALDSPEEKGNAAEGTETLRTCRCGVTQRRWDFRSHRTGSGGTKPCGAIKEPTCGFELNH